MKRDHDPLTNDYIDNWIAPSPSQWTNSPIVLLSIDFDFQNDSLDQWEDYTNYVGSPLKSAIEEAILSIVSESVEIEIPDGVVLVKIQDTPPRSDGLFPVYFVDLLPIFEYLKNTLPADVASALIELVVQELAQKIWSLLPLLPSKRHMIKQSVSPKTLSVLCKSFAEVHSGLSAMPEVHITQFNTRIEGGYPYPIDESQPMGWHVAVYFDDEVLYNFIVDQYANVISLTVHKDNGAVPISEAKLLQPEIARDRFRAIIEGTQR